MHLLSLCDEIGRHARLKTSSSKWVLVQVQAQVVLLLYRKQLPFLILLLVSVFGLFLTFSLPLFVSTPVITGTYLPHLLLMYLVMPFLYLTLSFFISRYGFFNEIRFITLWMTTNNGSWSYLNACWKVRL